MQFAAFTGMAGNDTDVVEMVQGLLGREGRWLGVGEWCVSNAAVIGRWRWD